MEGEGAFVGKNLTEIPCHVCHFRAKQCVFTNECYLLKGMVRLVVNRNILIAVCEVEC